MSSNNKVVWSDGLFVKPHHFQQQARFQERHAIKLASASNGFNYGFQSLTLNDEMLMLGKIGLVQAAGIMPDGTPFDIPGEDLQPSVLDVSEGFTANETVFLCMPLSMEGGVEVQAQTSATGNVGARFVANDTSVRDNTEQAGELAAIKVAQAPPVLMLGSKDLSAFTKLAVAKIVEKTNDNALVLDQNYYPTMLSISSAPPLRRLLSELADGVEQRAKSIAVRIGQPNQNGVADVSDFLLLQALNRFSPILRHYNRLPTLHPREVFELLIQIVGELSTFISDDKLVPSLAAYNHDLPAACWPEITHHLRQLITATLVANVVPIPHQRKLHGYVVAPIHERELIATSDFVLAVKANVPQERLHRDFPAQSKVSSIERIRELVSKQLPGIPLRLMPVAPRQLPYHAGYTYFALDKTSAAWADMTRADGFGFHIAGEFPELEMQFWAIKG